MEAGVVDIADLFLDLSVGCILGKILVNLFVLLSTFYEL